MEHSRTDVSESNSSPRPAISGCPVCASTNAVQLFPSDPAEQWHLAQCRDCTQYYTDPHPTLDDMAGFYSGDYHKEVLTVESTIRIFGPKFTAYTDWVTRYVKGGRSLDIGCSTGLFPHMLAQKGFQAEGLEMNPSTADFAREQFGLKISSEPFEIAEYAPDSFSLISLTDVLEHALSPFITLQRVHSLLQDGGFAFITFPDIESLESRYLRKLAKLSKRDWLWENCHIPGHTWEFTRPTAEGLFKRAGFTVAGFRRAHVDNPDSRKLLHSMLRLPVKLLGVPILGRAFGTQMEFVLRK